MRILRATLAPVLLTAGLVPQETTVAAPGTPLPVGAPKSMAQIDRGDLLAHAEYLSRDALGGRLTGSPGMMTAARYIAEHFAELGLEPLGDLLEPSGTQAAERDWLQRYPISRSYLDEPVVTAGEHTFREGFAVLHRGEKLDLDLEGTWSFFGFGRTRGEDAELGGDADLSGTIPLILLGTPPGQARSQSIEQQFLLGTSVLARLRQLAFVLASRGARAVVVAMIGEDPGVAEALNYMALAPGKDLLEPRGALRSMVDPGGMSSMGRTLAGRIPSLFLSREVSAQILDSLGVGAEELQTYRDSRRAADLPGGDGVQGRLEIRVRVDEEAEGVNVVGLLRGGDPNLHQDAVVFSAHMDHVGRRLDGDVFNGADDNASGTAGLMEIAQAFTSGAAPARSVIFLAVSGEELGLWGSAYFAARPPWDKDRIAANINTDMIGRSGPDSGPDEVAITPSHRHRAFSTMVRDAAEFAGALGIGLRNGDQWYTRSDHYNFARLGIPVVFFCDGEHEDYHQVSDHFDKLDGAKMERIARLAFWTGYQVANADQRPRRLGRQPAWKD